MKIKINSVEIEAIKGNITHQPDLEVVVNAANDQLAPGGGVAGAIHKVAGPDLYKACKILAPIKPGEAVITKAFLLPNKFVIHCLGPVYGKDKPEEKLLANCYKESLKLCEEYELNSIGFPAISTGIFGYPPREAVQVVLQAVKETIAEVEKIKTIKFVLFSNEDLHIYEEALKDFA